jgi:ribosomal protein S18 acetylase RimI-like enzyme
MDFAAPDHLKAHMQIRDGVPADAPTLVEFNARMALETEGKTLDRATLTRGVERVLRDRTLGRYFVVDGPDGSVVGCLMVTLEWSDWRDGHFWWIQSVYVRDDVRGRGVYSSLHRHVVEEATRAGNVVGVRLYVEPHNARAQRTYEKLGMKKTYDVMEQPLEHVGPRS